MARIFGLLVFFTMLSSCVSQPATTLSQGNVTVVYSANLDGELEPCGCSESGNLGGIKRRVHRVDQLREQYPNLVLLSAGGLLVSELPQDKLKSEYILKGLSVLNYDAVGVQTQDLAFGEEFIAQHPLPLVLSNQVGDTFLAQKEIQRDGITLSYFQWEQPDEATSMAGYIGETEINLEDLKLRIRTAKQKGAVVILGTTLSQDAAAMLFDLSNVDVLIVKSQYEEYAEPKRVGDTIVLQAGSRGMRLGKLDLTISGGKINTFKHEVIPLPESVGEAPRMQSWYAEYNQKVTEAYQLRVAEMRKLLDQPSPYAGEQACVSCHQKEHDIWFDTPHAEAYYQLMDNDKGFDPDCIGCHVLAFEKPGGFIDPMLTSDKMHVQCENCHGAAKAHVESEGKVKTANNTWKPQQMCAQCHVQKHSPDFEFSRYWPRIKHGG